MDELKTNIRARIREYLELLADADAQRKYQAEAPVQVSNELINQWDDWFHPESKQLRSWFEDNEWVALIEYNSVLLDVCERTPPRLPPLAEFMRTAEWTRLHEAACAALRRLRP
jgi:hypothetical protein